MPSPRLSLSQVKGLGLDHTLLPERKSYSVGVLYDRWLQSYQWAWCGHHFGGAPYQKQYLEQMAEIRPKLQKVMVLLGICEAVIQDTLKQPGSLEYLERISIPN